VYIYLLNIVGRSVVGHKNKTPPRVAYAIRSSFAGKTNRFPAHDRHEKRKLFNFPPFRFFSRFCPSFAFFSLSLSLPLWQRIARTNRRERGPRRRRWAAKPPNCSRARLSRVPPDRRTKSTIPGAASGRIVATGGRRTKRSSTNRPLARSCATGEGKQTMSVVAGLCWFWSA